MILILSNKKEPSTDAVVDYLLHRNIDFIRINSEDLLNHEDLNIDVSSNTWVIGGQRVNLDMINVVWYRRWNSFDGKFDLNTIFKNQVLREMTSELDELSNYLFLRLQEKKFLSDIQAIRKHNKLYTLTLAANVGLNIPNSLVINSKEILLKDIFNEQYITKPIADSYAFSGEGDDLYKVFTEPLLGSVIEKLDNNFFPSLFQEKVESQFEIRTFFLDGDFFSTAILNSTTLDVKRSVGFHAEDVKMVPFLLQQDIREKLQVLMNKLELNCGAIDLIKDKDGKFYFLEINPIGQFLGYSNYCNYQIEEKIANWLIANDNDKV